MNDLNQLNDVENPEEGYHFSQLGAYACNLWKDNLLTDVTMKLNDKYYQAHSPVLSCHSTYFRRLISNFKFDTIELDGLSINNEAFEKLLHYMYTGRLHITIQNFDEIYIASQKLGIEKVLQLCGDILMGATDPNVQCIYLYATAKKLKEPNCSNYALEMMSCYFEQIVLTSEFLDLTVDEIIEYLSYDQLAVDSEILVYTAALKWLDYKLKEREIYIEKVLKCVRFPLMTLDEILNCFCPPLISKIAENPAVEHMLLAATCYIASKAVDKQGFFEKFARKPRNPFRPRESRGSWDSNLLYLTKHTQHKLSTVSSLPRPTLKDDTLPSEKSQSQYSWDSAISPTVSGVPFSATSSNKMCYAIGKEINGTERAWRKIRNKMDSTLTTPRENKYDGTDTSVLKRDYEYEKSLYGNNVTYKKSSVENRGVFKNSPYETNPVSINKSSRDFYMTNKSSRETNITETTSKTVPVINKLPNETNIIGGSYFIETADNIKKSTSATSKRSESLNKIAHTVNKLPNKMSSTSIGKENARSSKTNISSTKLPRKKSKRSLSVGRTGKAIPSKTTRSIRKPSGRICKRYRALSNPSGSHIHHPHEKDFVRLSRKKKRHSLIKPISIISNEENVSPNENSYSSQLQMDKRYMDPKSTLRKPIDTSETNIDVNQKKSNSSLPRRPERSSTEPKDHSETSTESDKVESVISLSKRRKGFSRKSKDQSGITIETDRKSPRRRKGISRKSKDLSATSTEIDKKEDVISSPRRRKGNSRKSEDLPVPSVQTYKEKHNMKSPTCRKRIPRKSKDESKTSVNIVKEESTIRSPTSGRRISKKSIDHSETKDGINKKESINCLPRRRKKIIRKSKDPSAISIEI